MFDCLHASTPMSTSSSLSLYDGEPLSDPSLYRSIVGALQYYTITRPDISFSVNKVYQFMHSSTTTHWQAVKRILCYLKIVSRSSVESEYRGLANAALELIWIETFLIELHIPFFTLPVLFCDNLNATHLVAHPILHARTKHIEINYHFIRDRVLHKSPLVQFTPSKEQLADILTKFLPVPRFQSLRDKLTVLHNPLCLQRDVKQCN
ncbi:Retrovirus-related Pol polyprotein from transposon RE1 [Vitis vinifera]|uniref:Retrovirus-related Pol polyprotein from transposon RE1 n=1 Tax=Vitis vinifera TaxID=29760 RepID=A0A438IT20_VITVI|nr:Retrovirus-related Pol polyprotein from transposon RE1 [Vitis vinifera]